MPALVLIVAFIVVPVAELAVIIEVGRAIGVGPTLAILVADSILGGVLLRAQGRAAWRRFTETMRSGRVPHREALDGALVIFGGALLLTPGFLTDALGLILLIPPTRVATRRLVAGLIVRRVFVGAAGLAGRRGSSPRREYDVDGTATDADRAPGEASAPRIER